MTTISAGAYSPGLRSLTPLNHDQVKLLNKDEKHDITSRVQEVVQRHLGYKGTEKFRVEFTRQQIKFSLKSGSDVQNHTLTYVSGQWMLKKNSAAPTALDPELQKEVDGLIDDVLYNIRQTQGSGPSRSRSHSFTYPSVASYDAYPRYTSATQFYPFETPPFDHPTSSLDSFRGRSPHSTESFRSRSPDSRSERDDALRRVKDLENSLSGASRKSKQDLAELHQSYEQTMMTGRDRYEKLQSELFAAQRELEKLQNDNAAKGIAADESQQKIAKLEASVAEKETQLTQNREALQQAVEAQKAIKLELASLKGSLEGLQTTAQKQKTDLEEQLKLAQEEHASLKKTDKEALAKATLEIAGLNKKDEENTAKLASQSTQLHEASRAAEKNEKEIAKLKQSVAEKEAQLRKNHESLEALKTQATAETEHATASLRESQATAKKQIAELEKQVGGLSSELSQAKKTHQEALARANLEIAALKSQNETLLQQLAAVSSATEAKFADDIAGLRHQIKETSKKLKDAARLAAEDKMQIEEHKTSLSSATTQLAKMKELEAQTVQLNRDLEEAKKKHLEESSASAQKTEKHIELLKLSKKRLNTQHEEIETLKASLEQVTELKAHYEYQLRSTAGELQALKDRLSEIETAYQELTRSASKIDGKKAIIQTGVIDISIAKIVDASAPKPFSPPKALNKDE